jgi:hypothetical protein
MKIAYPLIVVACFLTRPVLAQVKTSPADLSSTISQKSIDELPFAKGKWEFPLIENFGYNYQSLSVQGQNEGHQDNFKLDLGAKYFVANGIGVGLDFNLQSKGTYDAEGDGSTTSKWMVYGGLEYGFNLNPGLGLYFGADIGVGNDHISYTAGTNSGTSSPPVSNGLFGYKIEAGLPIHLFPNSPVYLTPQIGFDHLHTSFPDGKEADNHFRIGLALETYMGCGDYESDCHHGFSLSRAMYQPGRSFFDFTTRAGLGFGSEKTTENGVTGGTVDVFDDCFDICYGYYPVRNIAIGADFGIGGNSQNYGSEDYKTSTDHWQIGPMVQFNLPVDNGWNNTFLKLDLGFGGENSTTTYTGTGSGTSSSTKYDLFNFGAMLGYNDFFTKNLAFTPKIGYRWGSEKNTDTDIKEHLSGPAIEFGVRLFF